MTRTLLSALSLALLPLVLFFFAAPARASSNITVNSVLDVIADDGHCTLREAVIAVNTQKKSGNASGECQAGSGNDTINLPSGTISITISGPLEDASLTGDYDITRSVTILGAGTTCASPPNALCTIVNGNSLDRVFDITTTAQVTLSQMEITGGRAVSGGMGTGMGGGIQNRGVLSMNNLLVIANSAAVYGGGLSNPTGAVAILDTVSFGDNSSDDSGGSIYNSGTITLTNVSFNGSTSSSEGGVLDNTGNAALTDVTVAHGTAANNGGGIFNHGNLTLDRVTFNDNEATTGSGGALENYFGSAAVTNTTFARNHADASGMVGGAIFAYSGPMTLTNVTIANNSADSAGGIELEFGTIAVKNTIVYFNPNGNCDGPVISLGHNLEGGDTCSFSAAGDITETNPFLGPLSDNGGLTKTRALLPGSPAIDAGANIGCPSIDQRGAHRPIGKKCDIGAYEAGYLFLPFISK
jgi:CSLREA domain-containing protein